MSRVKLSVNINKIATIRNARGGNTPDLIAAAERIQSYGAQGITVHPRPDERHIRYEDVRQLKDIVSTEFNIEGYPSREWMDLVIEVKPTQATLVPDAPDVLTSNSGWDTVKHQTQLMEIIEELKSNDIRTSIFVNTDLDIISGAEKCGADRIELYTESYATNFYKNSPDAVNPFAKAAAEAGRLGLGVNAGHDLNLRNLQHFANSIPELLEVSIGHALISDALYYGLENSVQMYLSKLPN